MCFVNLVVLFIICSLMKEGMLMLQIPDERRGDDIIEAVVVDKESIGSDARGCGAKILYGKGSFKRYKV